MASVRFADSNEETHLDWKNNICIVDEENVSHLLLTWTIENFHLMPKDEQKSLTSPCFQSGFAMWYLNFTPYYKLKDKKCARFVLIRQSSEKISNTITLTYRIGVRTSGMTTWFQEKRGRLLSRSKNHSDILVTINDFFSNVDEFYRNNIIVFCEMYISQFITKESLSKKYLNAETMDMLQLSFDVSRLNTKENDVIIRVKDLNIPSHKAILSARSVVFARMLKDKRECLKLKNKDRDHISNVLAYIYSGCLPYVPETRTLCIGLYECAERYSVNGLKELLAPTKISASTSISVEKINFTWMIENFNTVAVEVNECMLSPVFDTGAKNVSEWRLELYPKGRLETPDSIGIFLKNSTLRDSLHINIQISILDKNKKESFKKCSDKTWTPQSVHGFPKFIDKKALAEHLLENDTLILNCKIELRIPTTILAKTSLICHSSMTEHAGFERLSKDFEKLISNKSLSDTAIVLANGMLNFHKAILVARSPVFAQRIKECKEKECVIGIRDVSRDILQKLIFYVYTGKIRKLTPQTAIKLYAAAKKYEVESLMNRCVYYLVAILDIECFRDIFVLADKHKIELLMTSCSRLFKRKQERILSSIDWENFSITKKDFVSKLSTWLSRSTKGA